MIKSALAFLTALLIAGAAAAQNPPSSAAPQYNKSKNVWAGDNFEQVCPITATGSPGTFTPICPSNNITITASGQTIAMPIVGTPPGYQPGQVTKSVELNIFYAAPYAPIFASGYGFINGTAPVQCSLGGTGCLSAAVSSKPDLLECRTVNETQVRCGSVLTAVGAPSGIALVNQATCASAGGGNCTTSAANMTGANLIVFAEGYYNNSGAVTASIADSNSNAYTTSISPTSGSTSLKCGYVFAPTVTSNMTFSTTSTGGSAFAALSVAGFSGIAASPLDQTATGTGAFGATSVGTGTTGTLTQGNELIMPCLSLAGTPGGSSSGIGVATGTLLGVINSTSGTTEGTALAYFTQSGTAPVSDSFSWTGSLDAAAGIMTFK